MFKFGDKVFVDNTKNRLCHECIKQYQEVGYGYVVEVKLDGPIAVCTQKNFILKDFGIAHIFDASEVAPFVTEQAKAEI